MSHNDVSRNKKKFQHYQIYGKKEFPRD